VEGVNAVRARIAAIQGSFGALRSAAPSTADASGFAAALVNAEGSAAPQASVPGSTPERTQWASDLLARLGMPKTSENVRALSAWAQAEGTSAKFNPLATTQRAPGATNFNSVGVKNFVSYEQGLDATVQTLKNGRYGAILDALKAGNSATAVGRAVEASPWGTGGLMLRVLGAS
jgi:hypothetical protein